jgi:hypothetical protein
MELMEAVMAFRSAKFEEAVSAQGVARIVGQTVADWSSDKARRVLLVARSNFPVRAEPQRHETNVYALKRGAPLQCLARIRHHDYAAIMVKNCGADVKSPYIAYQISVACASASPDLEFLAVTLECRLSPVRGGEIMTEPPHALASYCVVLFHPARQQSVIAREGPNVFYVPVMTVKGSKPCLLIYHQPAVVDVTGVFSRPAATPAQAAALQEQQRRQRQLQQKTDAGRRRVRCEILDFEPVGTNALLHKFLPNSMKPKLNVEMQENDSLKLLPQNPNGDVLWFQHDPWDHSLFTLSKYVANLDEYVITDHLIERDIASNHTIRITLPINLRVRFDRVTHSHNVSRDSDVNMRHWVTRSGTNAFAIQVREGCVNRRGYGGITVHLARFDSAVGYLLGADKLSEVCFGPRGQKGVFTFEATQRCTTERESCRVRYFSFTPTKVLTPDGKGERKIRKGQLLTLDDLYALDLEAVLRGLADFCPIEICILDTRNELKKRAVWNPRVQHPPSSKNGPLACGMDKVFRSLTVDPHSYDSVSKLGWSHHHRVVLFIHGADQFMCELAIPKREKDRAVFVRMYGMLALIFHSRPAILIDLETKGPPQYLFSCPILDHPDAKRVDNNGNPYNTSSDRFEQTFAGPSAAAGAADATPRRGVSPLGADRRTTMVPSSVGTSYAPPQFSGAFTDAASPPFRDTDVNSTSDSDALTGPSLSGTQYQDQSPAFVRGSTAATSNVPYPPDQRYTFMTLPMAYNRCGDDTDRPVEMMTESLAFDQIYKKSASAPDSRLILLEPQLLFINVLDYVVLPHIRAALSESNTDEQLRVRHSLFLPARRPANQRTRREANLVAAFNALAIATSRLVHLADGRMVTLDTVGVWFDTIAAEVFSFDAGAMRSSCLYMLIGFFAEAFQRIATASKIAQATAARVLQGPAAARNSSSSPKHSTKGAAATAGAQHHYLQQPRASQQQPLAPFCGFESKFKMYCDINCHPHLSPMLRSYVMTKGPQDRFCPFGYCPPHRGQMADGLKPQMRWHVERGDPEDPEDFIGVLRQWTDRQDNEMQYQERNAVPPPPTRYWDQTMPNPTAIPLFDSDMDQAYGSIPSGTKRSRRAAEAAAANPDLRSEKCLDRTTQQSKYLTWLGESQVHLSAAATGSPHGRRAASPRGGRGANPTPRAGGPGNNPRSSFAPGAPGRASASLSEEDIRSLKCSIESFENRLTDLTFGNADQLLAYSDIILAMQALRCDRNAKKTLLKVIQDPLQLGLRARALSSFRVNRLLDISESPPQPAKGHRRTPIVGDKLLPSPVSHAPHRGFPSAPSPQPDQQQQQDDGAATATGGPSARAPPMSTCPPLEQRPRTKPLPDSLILFLTRRNLLDFRGSGGGGATNGAQEDLDVGRNSDVDMDDVVNNDSFADSSGLTPNLAATSFARSSRPAMAAGGRSPRHGFGHATGNGWSASTNRHKTRCEALTASILSPSTFSSQRGDQAQPPANATPALANAMPALAREDDSTSTPRNKPHKSNSGSGVGGSATALSSKTPPIQTPGSFMAGAHGNFPARHQQNAPRADMTAAQHFGNMAFRLTSV